MGQAVGKLHQEAGLGYGGAGRRDSLGALSECRTKLGTAECRVDAPPMPLHDFQAGSHQGRCGQAPHAVKRLVKDKEGSMLCLTAKGIDQVREPPSS